jgi:hypothetical protein
MQNPPNDSTGHPQGNDRADDRWHTFADILRRLHHERIYIHPDQLAEFLLVHGLPVELCYVPPHLRQKAQQVNANYRGDMARLEVTEEPPQKFSFE